MATEKLNEREVKNGAMNPRLETLYRIAVALGVDIEELIGHTIDEEAVKINRLLEGQDKSVKEMAVRMVEVVANYRRL